MEEEKVLVSASVLDKIGILRKSTAYRMAKSGKIPSYVVGEREGGVRFVIAEVLAALRRPAMQHDSGAVKEKTERAARVMIGQPVGKDI